MGGGHVAASHGSEGVQEAGSGVHEGRGEVRLAGGGNGGLQLTLI